MNKQVNWSKRISIILMLCILGFFLYRASQSGIDFQMAFYLFPILFWALCLGILVFAGLCVIKMFGSKSLVAKYVILTIITLAIAMYAESEFEGASLIVLFSFWGLFSLIASYDVCRARGRELTTLIFPLLFGWIGFFIILLFLREEGEKEYPFQKMF